MTGSNDVPQSTAREKQGGHKEHKEQNKIMSLSVFIGVYRWLKKSFHHRCTPMNTDKSLMKKYGDRLLLPVSFSGQVTP
jgi:hypothetical protein